MIASRKLHDSREIIASDALLKGMKRCKNKTERFRGSRPARSVARSRARRVMCRCANFTIQRGSRKRKRNHLVRWFPQLLPTLWEITFLRGRCSSLANRENTTLVAWNNRQTDFKQRTFLDNVRTCWKEGGKKRL